jgi:hypothetical protein
MNVNATVFRLRATMPYVNLTSSAVTTLFVTTLKQRNDRINGLVTISPDSVFVSEFTLPPPPLYYPPSEKDKERIKKQLPSVTALAKSSLDGANTSNKSKSSVKSSSSDTASLVSKTATPLVSSTLSGTTATSNPAKQTDNVDKAAADKKNQSQRHRQNTGSSSKASTRIEPVVECSDSDTDNDEYDASQPFQIPTSVSSTSIASNGGTSQSVGAGMKVDANGDCPLDVLRMCSVEVARRRLLPNDLTITLFKVNCKFE